MGPILITYRKKESFELDIRFAKIFKIFFIEFQTTIKYAEFIKQKSFSGVKVQVTASLFNF